MLRVGSLLKDMIRLKRKEPPILCSSYYSTCFCKLLSLRSLLKKLHAQGCRLALPVSSYTIWLANPWLPEWVVLLLLIFIAAPRYINRRILPSADCLFFCPEMESIINEWNLSMLNIYPKYHTHCKATVWIWPHTVLIQSDRNLGRSFLTALISENYQLTPEKKICSRQQHLSSDPAWRHKALGSGNAEEDVDCPTLEDGRKIVKHEFPLSWESFKVRLSKTWQKINSVRVLE